MTNEPKAAPTPGATLRWHHAIPASYLVVLAESLDGDERMTFDGVWFAIEGKSPLGPIGAWQVKYQFGSRPEAEEEMMADGAPNPRVGSQTASDNFRVTSLSQGSREAILLRSRDPQHAG
jgi:hypothetical protein